MIKVLEMLAVATESDFHLQCKKDHVHYAKSYRPFELFVNENYKL